MLFNQRKKVKRNCSSPRVNLTFTVFSIFFTSQTQFFLVLKACSHSVLWTLHASSKRLIQVYCLLYVFFSSKFPHSIKNLSGGAVFIFRRCFRSSLSAFCKITSAKFLGKHVCRIIFLINL